MLNLCRYYQSTSNKTDGWEHRARAGEISVLNSRSIILLLMSQRKVSRDNEEDDVIITLHHTVSHCHTSSVTLSHCHDGTLVMDHVFCLMSDVVTVAQSSWSTPPDSETRDAESRRGWRSLTCLSSSACSSSPSP